MFNTRWTVGPGFLSDRSTVLSTEVLYLVQSTVHRFLWNSQSTVDTSTDRSANPPGFAHSPRSTSDRLTAKTFVFSKFLRCRISMSGEVFLEALQWKGIIVLCWISCSENLLPNYWVGLEWTWKGAPPNFGVLQYSRACLDPKNRHGGRDPISFFSGLYRTVAGNSMYPCLYLLSLDIRNPTDRQAVYLEDSWCLCCNKLCRFNLQVEMLLLLLIHHAAQLFWATTLSSFTCT